MAEEKRTYPFTIGACTYRMDDEGRRICEIRKGTTSNGMCYKDWEIFYEYPSRPCYQAELADDLWTQEDFLKLAEGDEKIAEFIFDGVDWQSPYTFLDESFREGEIKRCPECGRLYLTGGDEGCWCPHCGIRTVYVTVEKTLRVQRKVPLTQEEYNTLCEKGAAGGIGKLRAVIIEAPDEELFGFTVPEDVDTGTDYSIVDDDGRILVDWD